MKTMVGVERKSDRSSLFSMELPIIRYNPPSAPPKTSMKQKNPTILENSTPFFCPFRAHIPMPTMRREKIKDAGTIQDRRA